MSQVHVEVSRDIPVETDILYAIVSDYEVGHQAILPKPYFTEMIVTKGGCGAGTEITVHMNVFDSKQSFHQRIEEPEAGRVILECNIHDDWVTGFTFDPINNGAHTRVTITADFTPKNIGERLMNPPIMRNLFRKELHNLEVYALENQQSIVTA